MTQIVSVPVLPSKRRRRKAHIRGFIPERGAHLRHFTDAQVLWVRRHLFTAKQRREFAKEHNVSEHCVHAMFHGYTYAHVTGFEKESRVPLVRKKRYTSWKVTS